MGPYDYLAHVPIIKGAGGIITDWEVSVTEIISFFTPVLIFLNALQLLWTTNFPLNVKSFLHNYDAKYKIKWSERTWHITIAAIALLLCLMWLSGGDIFLRLFHKKFFSYRVSFPQHSIIHEPRSSDICIRRYTEVLGIWRTFNHDIILRWFASVLNFKFSIFCFRPVKEDLKIPKLSCLWTYQLISELYCDCDYDREHAC